MERCPELEPVKSATPPVSTTRCSRPCESVRREMRKHTEQAEARANAAYEQNRAALELTCKSMDNGRDVFTEARRTYERFRNLLFISPRARQHARWDANISAPLVQRANRSATDRLYGAADYRRCPRVRAHKATVQRDPWTGQ